ncbi:hypothetical protein MPLA_140339 [Mesorhizobium sp. ORS 3359]|nr:hypothetical protein MPLA_140339 [Mesorhizobium sp. ORS 3359]
MCVPLEGEQSFKPIDFVVPPFGGRHGPIRIYRALTGVFSGFGKNGLSRLLKIQPFEINGLGGFTGFSVFAEIGENGPAEIQAGPLRKIAHT